MIQSTYIDKVCLLLLFLELLINVLNFLEYHRHSPVH